MVNLSIFGRPEVLPEDPEDPSGRPFRKTGSPEHYKRQRVAPFEVGQPSKADR